MAKIRASAPPPAPELPGLDEPGVAGEDEEGLDLEAYLDLEESPEITRLMQNLRGERQGSAARADAGSAAPAGTGAEASTTGHGPAAGAGRPGGDRAPACEPLPAESGVAAPVREGGSGADGKGRAARGARAGSAGPEAHAWRGAPLPVDLEAVARALGDVQVQGGQLVVACPACEGRPAIVIYANRFKCFGCDATGDVAALTALLTGWDERRVVLWLAAARRVPVGDGASDRRSRRFPLFAR